MSLTKKEQARLDYLNSLESGSVSEQGKASFYPELERDTLNPFYNTLKYTIESAKAGQDWMMLPFNDLSFKNLALGALGGLMWATAPISGISGAFIGKPVQELAKAAGVDDKTAEWVGLGAEFAVGFSSVFTKSSKVKTLLGKAGLINMGEDVTKLRTVVDKLASKSFLSDEISSFIKEGNVSELNAALDATGFSPKYFNEMFKTSIKRSTKFVDENKLSMDSKEFYDDLIGNVSKSTNETVAFEVNKILENKSVSPLFLERVYGEGIVKAEDVLSTLPKNLKPEDLYTKGISVNVEKIVTDGTYEALLQNYDKSKKIINNVAERLVFGEIQIEDLKNILPAYDISTAEFARDLVETGTYSGKFLAQLSHLKKRLRKFAENNPEAAKILDEMHSQYIDERSLGDVVIDGLVKMEDFRRGLLVTQLATAVRNGFSQSGMLALGTVENCIAGGITGFLKGNGIGRFKDAAQGLTAGWDNLVALADQMTPSGFREFGKILDTSNAVMSKARLMSSSMLEANIPNKVVTALNVVNRTQERFFQRVAYEGKLRQLLHRTGKNLDDINPVDIPEDFHKAALDYALEMTFAKSPDTKWAKNFLMGWKKAGLTTVNPFPRFTFANALPFALDHSPLGLVKVLGDKKTLTELASGNPERFAKEASKMLTGYMMFNAAWNLRQSEYAGEKWYEIKKGENEVVDIRPFAPFSNFFWLADATLRPDKVKVSDFAQLAVGLSRVSGTGLSIVDMIRAKDFNGVMDVGATFMEGILASYTIPMKTFKDIESAFSEEDRYYRDVEVGAETGVFGKAITNLPYAGRIYGRSFSPLREEPIETDHPLYKQFLGLNIRSKTTVEKEVDRLGLDPISFRSKTGFKKADYEIDKNMGRYVNYFVGNMVESDGYRKLEDHQKRMVVKDLIKAIKSQVVEDVKTLNPDVELGLYVKRLDKDKRKELAARMGVDAAMLESLWDDHYYSGE